VGRGADANCHVGIGAVPVFKEDRRLAHLRQLAAQLHPQAGALHPRVELGRGRFWTVRKLKEGALSAESRQAKIEAGDRARNRNDEPCYQRCEIDQKPPV
jgi:hypothetical protein